MRYVIDIKDIAYAGGEPKLWRAKGFRTLVFDAEGLSRLTPLDKLMECEIAEAEDRGYEKGYDVGCEAGIEAGKKMMRDTVTRNLHKMLEKSDLLIKSDAVEKQKPEADGYDSCLSCRWIDSSEESYPCNECKHCYNDKYERVKTSER